MCNIASLTKDSAFCSSSAWDISAGSDIPAEPCGDFEACLHVTGEVNQTTLIDPGDMVGVN